MRWARPGSMFDVLVRSLRVVLPSIVGVLCAIMLISPFGESKELSFVLAKDDVAKTTDRMRIADALYRGEDDLGRPFSLRAGNAVQRSADQSLLEMSDLAGSMIIDNSPAKIVAGKSSYDFATETVQVSGPMSFDSGAGYSLVAHDVNVAMKSQMVRSQGMLTVESNKGYSVSGSDVSYAMRSQQLSSPGIVRFRTTDGYVLDASNVLVDMAGRRMQSLGPANGQTNLGTFRADRLRADLDARTVTLTGNVQLRINQNVIR